MILPTDPDKYLSKWKYLEVGHWIPKHYKSGKPAVIRHMDYADPENPVPILLTWDEVQEFAKKHNNSGVYTSVWQFDTKDPKESTTMGSLYFDFDDEEDFVSCTKQTQRLFEHLREYVPPEYIHVYFSGSKGYHIECEALALGITPSNELHNIFRNIANDLQQKLDLPALDFSVYDVRRMWRLLNTKHPITGLYKRDVTLQMQCPDVGLIKHMAKEPGWDITTYHTPKFDAKANEWYREYVYQTEVEAKQKNLSPEEMIERFRKYGSNSVVHFDDDKKQFDPVKLFENCPAILKHWRTAEETGELSHEARLFLCSILTYTDEAIWYLHEILRNTKDYNPTITQAHIDDWVRRREKGIGGRPYSCRRANSVGVGCGNCDLEPKKRVEKVGDSFVETEELAEPSPIRFGYRYVTK